MIQLSQIFTLFFLASVAQDGSCLHAKLHRRNSQEVSPRGRSMEKQRNSTMVATHVAKGCNAQQCKWLSGQVWWGKKPFSLLLPP